MVNILLNKLQLYFYFLKNKFDDQKRKLFMTHHPHTWRFRKPILTRFANKTVSSGKRILFYVNKVYISERECCLRLSNESLIIFFYILLYFFFSFKFDYTNLKISFYSYNFSTLLCSEILFFTFWGFPPMYFGGLGGIFMSYLVDSCFRCQFDGEVFFIASKWM